MPLPFSAARRFPGSNFAARVGAAFYRMAALVAEDVALAVREQDVVVTTTPSRSPLVRREWVSPGTHINAVGADSPGKQELDPGILIAARIFVDDWAQAKDIGEINVPLARGQDDPMALCSERW